MKFLGGVGLGIILYLSRNTIFQIFNGIYNSSPLTPWQWVMVCFILFNIWLWKSNNKHPFFEVLWKYLLSAYKVIFLALALKYFDNKFFNNKK